MVGKILKSFFRVFTERDEVCDLLYRSSHGCCRGCKKREKLLAIDFVTIYTMLCTWGEERKEGGLESLHMRLLAVAAGLSIAQRYYKALL